VTNRSLAHIHSFIHPSIHSFRLFSYDRKIEPRALADTAATGVLVPN